MIYIYGAGSIGAYIGGRLGAAGVEVVLLGRPRLRDAIEADGLRCTDYLGGDHTTGSTELRVETEPEILSKADLVLLTVKSGDTEAAAQEIAAQCRDNTPVISFQNGIRNPQTLRQYCPQLRIIAGMVPFNVIQANGVFHRGTEGELGVANDPVLEPFLTQFRSAGLALELHDDILAVQWGKLLGNLMNPINALGDCPFQAQLKQRPTRLLLARCQVEALNALKKAGIKPKSFTNFPQWLTLLVLRSPDAVFNLLSRGSIRIDAEARSSMWQDFEAGRKTEIDYLNGEVVTLGDKYGVDVSTNRRIMELIRQAEQGGRRNHTAAELFNMCTNLD